MRSYIFCGNFNWFVPVQGETIYLYAYSLAYCDWNINRDGLNDYKTRTFWKHYKNVTGWWYEKLAVAVCYVWLPWTLVIAVSTPIITKQSITDTIIDNTNYLREFYWIYPLSDITDERTLSLKSFIKVLVEFLNGYLCKKMFKLYQRLLS